MIGVRFLLCLFVMFKGDCNAVIQVNIGRTFNGKFVVLRQQFTPFHFITVDRPAVTVKPAPENRFSVLSYSICHIVIVKQSMGEWEKYV